MEGLSNGFWFKDVVSPDSGTTYSIVVDVDTMHYICSCPHYEYRLAPKYGEPVFGITEQMCKHARSLFKEGNE